MASHLPAIWKMADTIRRASICAVAYCTLLHSSVLVLGHTVVLASYSKSSKEPDNPLGCAASNAESNDGLVSPPPNLVAYSEQRRTNEKFQRLLSHYANFFNSLTLVASAFTKFSSLKTHRLLSEDGSQYPPCHRWTYSCRYRLRSPQGLWRMERSDPWSKWRSEDPSMFWTIKNYIFEVKATTGNASTMVLTSTFRSLVPVLGDCAKTYLEPVEPKVLRDSKIWQGQLRRYWWFPSGSSR